MKKLMMFLGLLMSSSLVFGQGASLGWVKTMGSGGADEGMAIVTDISGNIYTVGGFKGIVDFDPNSGTANLTSNGNFDIFIQKLDANGNFLWARSFGDTDTDQAFAIDTDANGDLIVTGFFSGTVDFDPGAGVSNLTATGYIDVFVLKLDTNGNLVWARSLNGTANAGGNGITFDNTGNIYLTGSFFGTVDFDPGAGINNITSNGGGFNPDMFVLKLDGNGNFLWVRSVGNVNPEYGNGIITDLSGNVLIVGSFWGTVDFDPTAGIFNLTSNGYDDVFVLRLDLNGNFNWVRRVGGVGHDAGMAITFDPSNNILLTGYFSNTVDFDPNAGVYSISSNGVHDIFVLKLSIKGGFLWARAMGSSESDFGYDIGTNAQGEVYTTGCFSQTVDFDPGTATKNFSSSGSLDIFVQKMDGNGNFLWAMPMGGSSVDIGRSIAVGTDCNFYLTGMFRTTTDFDPNAGVANRVSIGEQDIFVTKYSEGTIAYNSSFTAEVLCNGSGNSTVKVTGPAQSFGNPFYCYYLYEYFPGTSNPDVLVQTIAWWQQPVPYVYSPGPFTFSTYLQTGKHYYIKLGVWDACTAWSETRIYDIRAEAPHPEFHLSSNPNYGELTTFQTCYDIYLFETYEANNGLNYDRYYIDLWERDCGSSSGFSWKASLGWTWNTLPTSLDIKTLFNNQGVVFTAGKEYQVKLALGNDCDGWEDTTYNFCVVNCAVPKPLENNGNDISNDALNADFDIKLYPNPVQSVLNFSSDGVEINSLRVMNALGQTLNLVKAASSQLDVSDLPSGMYILEFETNQGLLRKQFIKQ